MVSVVEEREQLDRYGCLRLHVVFVEPEPGRVTRYVRCHFEKYRYFMSRKKRVSLYKNKICTFLFTLNFSPSKWLFTLLKCVQRTDLRRLPGRLLYIQETAASSVMGMSFHATIV